jgi:hypothetical protein
LKDQQQGKLYNTRTPHESKKRGSKGLQALYTYPAKNFFAQGPYVLAV